MFLAGAMEVGKAVSTGVARERGSPFPTPFLAQLQK